MDTQSQYDKVIEYCQRLFLHKNTDYGSAWRILRMPSVTDQLYIKARRIRTLEEVGESQIEDDIQQEYVAIVNYCIIAMMQLELGDIHENEPNIPSAFLEKEYISNVTETRDLMLAKNHDYGEAWRYMRVSSLTDLILMKIYRIKQIEDNKGLTLVSEGLKANYQDMLNYAVFALIRMDFQQETTSA